jgi:rfaE bifunctional protein kinase chain/domain
MEAFAKLLLQDCAKLRLLVVGDLMLDHWVWGKVSRISPEAPVPVVDVERYSYTPGGAANVVNNLRDLGVQVAIAGVVGKDDAGRRLAQTLKASGADTGALVKDPTRPTTLKTRIVAHSQQVVRADFESRQAIGEPILNQLLDCYRLRIQDCDAIVLSDYDKGLFQQRFVQELISLAKAAGRPVIVGPKPANLNRFDQADLVTLNAKEAEAASGLSTNGHRAVEAAAAALHAKVGVQNLVITRGENGMSLFPAKSGTHYHMPALASQVFDVSGAGDTVLALLSIASAKGLDGSMAIQLASHAAAVVVKKLGTATATAEEILHSLQH